MSQRMTVSQKIAQELHGNILRRNYSAGERLPTERELAIRYGVSRIPVREAMKILEQQGIVEIKHGSGNYVKNIDKDKIVEQLSQYLLLCNPELDELEEIWQVLECHAVAKACKNRTDAQARTIRQLTEGCAAEVNSALSGQPFSFIEADCALHQAIVSSCGNTLIANLLGSFHKSMSFKNSILVEQLNELSRIIGIHQALALAIEKQDEAKAIQAMEEDLALGRRMYTTFNTKYQTNEILGN